MHKPTQIEKSQRKQFRINGGCWHSIGRLIRLTQTARMQCENRDEKALIERETNVFLIK